MITFTNEELFQMAHAIECEYGICNDLSEKIYVYLEETTGKDYRM